MAEGLRKTKTRGRPRREPDAIDRANTVALGVIRVTELVAVVLDMPEGPEQRRMMALVDTMVADLQRILP